MKYAVISDVHGNYPALDACLRDAADQGADRFIYLGDYFLDFPYPNEVTETIRRTAFAAIRGNKEEYLTGYNHADAKKRLQLGSIRWNYGELTEANRNYLSALPAEAELRIGGARVWLFHNAGVPFGDTPSVRIGSRRFYYMMKEAPFNHEGFLSFIKLELSDPAFASRLDAMPNGAYLFGHTHVQWHFARGGKLLLNPGACGIPLDFDTRAAYSIIERCAGEWNVTERRVKYDVSKTVEDLRTSGLYRAAPDFSEVMIDALQSAQERVSFLILTANEAAEARGEHGQPFSNPVWREACAAYKRMEF